MKGTITCSCGAEVSLAGAAEALVDCPACGALHAAPEFVKATPAPSAVNVVGYATPGRADSSTTEAGWAIGAMLAGFLSVLSFLSALARLVESSNDRRATTTPYLLQMLGAALGFGMAFGLWRSSSICRIVWISIVTIGAIGVAAFMGPVAERTFQNGTVVTYLIAFFGPAAWLVLLDRGSWLRVLIGSALVIGWHISIVVLIILLRAYN